MSLRLLAACLAASTALATPAPRDAAPPRTAPAGSARTTAPAPAPLVLVLPFAAKGDAEPDWLSAGSAEFVGEGLSLSGYRIVDPDAREEALDAQGLDQEKRLTLATACDLARRVGARYVVTGTWRSEASKLSFTARMIDVQRLKLLRQGSASAHVSLIAPALAGVAVDVAGDGGRTPAAHHEIEKLAAVQQDAIMAWMQAAAEPDNAIEHLQAALAADPGFTRARLDLAEAYLEGDRAQQVPGTLQGVGVEAALAHRARAKVLLGRATLAMGDEKAGIALLKEGVDLDPQPDHLLSLGDAQLAAGQKEAARDLAKRVLAMVPGDEHAQEIVDQAEGREVGSGP